MIQTEVVIMTALYALGALALVAVVIAATTIGAVGLALFFAGFITGLITPNRG